MAEDHASHRWEDWTWDETVFEGTAPYYRQGRKPRRLWPMPSPSTSIWMDAGASSTSVVVQALSPCCSPTSSNR